MKLIRLPDAAALTVLLLFSLGLAGPVLAQQTNRYFAIGVDIDAGRAIHDQQQAGNRVEAFAFTPNGNWVMVANGKASYSDSRYFERLKDTRGRSFREVLEGRLAATAAIDSIAFTPRSRWLIVSGTGIDYSDPGVFAGTGLKTRLETIENSNEVIQTVSVGPEGRWIVVAGGRSYHAKLSEEMRKRLMDIEQYEKRLLKGAWFRPGRNEWLILAQNNYWSSRPIADRIDKKFRQFQRKGWGIDLVALDGANGVAGISSYQTRVREDDIADRIELELFSETGNRGASLTLWDLMRTNRVPGVAIALIRDNRVETVRGYGYLRQGKGFVSHDSIFSAASLSKAVAAYGILKVVERGDISLDTTPFEIAQRYPDSVVATWFDQLDAFDKEIGNYDKDWFVIRSQTITLRDLLNHTSGMTLSSIGLKSVSAGQTAEDVLLGTGKYRGNGVVRPGLAPPREEWNYSGGAFTLAEAMTATATGQDFPTLMRDLVLRPLNMTSSTFGSLTEQQKERHAHAHRKNLTAISYREAPGKAAGGLYTTALDYARFLTSVLETGGVTTGPREPFIDASLVREMLTPAAHQKSTRIACQRPGQCTAPDERCIRNQCLIPIRNGFVWSGLGVELSTFTGSDGEPATFWHGGTQAGYRSYFVASPEKDTAIVIFTNGDPEWPSIVPRRRPEVRTISNDPRTGGCVSKAEWDALDFVGRDELIADDNPPCGYRFAYLDGQDDDDCMSKDAWNALSSSDQEDAMDADSPPCGYDFNRRGARELTFILRDAFLRVTG